MLVHSLLPDAIEVAEPRPKPGLSGVYLGGGVTLTRNWLDQPMYVSSSDLIVTPHLLNLGLCEPHLTRVMLALLRPGQVMVDIGANVGYYSLIGGRGVYPGGAVHAFEPNPPIHRLLVDNLEVNGFSGMAQAHAVALSDRTGEAELLVFEGRTAAATLRPVSADYVDAFARRTGRATRSLRVPTLRLDEALAAVPEVHVMKIDAEGHEPEILRGGIAVLRRSRNLRILLEFVPFHHSRAEALAHLGLLGSLGFRLFRIDFAGNLSHHQDEDLLGFAFSDLLAVRLP